MSKRAKITIIIALAAALLLGIVAVVYFGAVRPYIRAKSTMPEDGQLTLALQEDTLLLTWPGSEGSLEYRVEVFRTEGEELVFNCVTQENTCSLPNEIVGENCTIRVNSVMHYKQFGLQRQRLGERALEATGLLTPPELMDPAWEADPDEKQVQVTYRLSENACCRLFHILNDGETEEVCDQSENSFSLQFGEDTLPIPDYDSPMEFALVPYRELPGMFFYGIARDMTLCRDDFLGRDLNLQYTDEGNNRFTLFWNETKGESYQVQQSDQDGNWTPLYQTEKTGERSYFTGHLAPYGQFCYRVVAIGGQVQEGSEFAAQSEPVTLETKESPIFCTIWPMQDMDAYKDATGEEVVGAVTGSKAYCVLEEREGRFAVRIGDGIGYIDSNYCLINLPEYIGELCLYDVTNSYASLYMVHEFEIPGVTDTVIRGYQNIELYDKTCLVPLLYPTARKLVKAGEAARDQGYRIKIYDSLRPQEATLDIYNRTEKILDDILPEAPFLKNVRIEDLNLPEPAEETDEEGNVTQTPLTYRDVMVGKYSLNYFLAKGASRHNYGVAMDLTLADAWGKDVKMQTSIHDLSHYSALENNNGAANKLAKIMKDAGFGGLVSEWWHFQDDEAWKDLSLPMIAKGLSGACWMKDENGWRYRREDGRYYCDCTVTVDGTSCTFDKDGYFQTESK